MYQEISNILPKRLRKKYIEVMKYADVQHPERKIGFVLVLGVVLASVITVLAGIVLSFVLSFFYELLFIGILFLVFEIVFYMIFVLKADGKGKSVETILPDALLLMAMNIKSGMTTDRALMMSALTEFGPLQKELNAAGKQILAGKWVLAFIVRRRPPTSRPLGSPTPYFRLCPDSTT